MGMFDEIKCKFPLPDLKPEEAWLQTATFQTKSFDPAMETYTITEEGRLILDKITWDIIPPEERENKDDIFPFLKPTSQEDIDTGYHGDITFYTGDINNSPSHYIWHEFKARFTEGTVTWIKRVYENKD